MKPLDQLIARRCPVCDSSADGSDVFLEQSFDPARLSASSYASRKLPEYMSYKLVTCKTCSTVFAVNAPSAAAIAAAYKEADYDTSEEARLAAEAYDAALKPFLPSLLSSARALEIGTGTGVFLSYLRKAGFAEIVGVEPSRAAIDDAEPNIRPFIREGVFAEADFEPESFDLICCFQTLEHVPDPRAFVEASRRLLRPGGMLVLITHDYKALINRVLGRHSPIIDIEHLQLFCDSSLRYLVKGGGLETATVTSIVNRYPLNYWTRLAPLPAPIKNATARLLTLTGIGRVRLGVNVGNLMTIGRKSLTG